MYQKNKNHIQRLTQGMLVILSLLGTNAFAEQVQDKYTSEIVPSNMAEEILIQGDSALVQITNKWQRSMQDSLAGQIQQSSKALIAINPVIAPQDDKGFRDNDIPGFEPGVEPGKKSPCVNPAVLSFSLDEQQLVRGASGRSNQVEG